MPTISQAIDIGDGMIKVKADGTYSFTADPAVMERFGLWRLHGDGWRWRHGDGDGRPCGDRCQRSEDRHRFGSVDDDGLTGGNAASTTNDLAVPNGDGDNNEATFTGTLGGSVGLDGARHASASRP